MPLLIKVLATPSLLSSLNLSQWQILLSQATASQLVGRIDYLMKIEGISPPKAIKWHFSSVTKIANKQRQQALREFKEVSKSLDKIETKLIFLKGATYIAKDLPCSHGRTLSDIDVLVDKEHLNHIEMVLKFSGWLKTEIEDYDDNYYRTWMHEIPPLTHTTRGTTLDVHHNILPSTNKDMPNVGNFDIEKVFVENVGEIVTLSDTDLCIHNAVHLFTESEFHNGLRDLSDFHLLLIHFQKDNVHFVDELIARAKSLGLYDYVRLAIRYTHLSFYTPINSTSVDELSHQSSLTGALQDFCFMQIFKPNHKSCRTWQYPIAQWMLYWRGHLIRMPLTLLIPHLVRKTIMRTKDLFKAEEPDTFLPK
jgi:hypothetical protein